MPILGSLSNRVERYQGIAAVAGQGENTWLRNANDLIGQKGGRSTKAQAFIPCVMQG